MITSNRSLLISVMLRRQPPEHNLPQTFSHNPAHLPLLPRRPIRYLLVCIYLYTYFFLICIYIGYMYHQIEFSFFPTVSTRLEYKCTSLLPGGPLRDTTLTTGVSEDGHLPINCQRLSKKYYCSFIRKIVVRVESYAPRTEQISEVGFGVRLRS